MKVSERQEYLEDVIAAVDRWVKAAVKEAKLEVVEEIKAEAVARRINVGGSWYRAIMDIRAEIEAEG